MAEPVRDQASGLRRMLARDGMQVLPVDAAHRDAGKTGVVVALARAAAALGRRVAILDESAGEIGAALSLTWRRELADLLSGESEWQDVALRAAGGITVVPAAKGLAALLESGQDGARLFAGFAQLNDAPDLMLLNLGSRSPGAYALLPKDAELLMVTRSSGDSVTGTYRRIKEHARRHDRRRFRLLVNQADEEEGGALHRAMASVASRFLGAGIAYAGSIPAGAAPGAPAWDALAQSLPDWPLAEFKEV